ncbi:MAG: LapA family protein [Deltaproteobacteria bacterium]|nr:LapA family protein [Deltaproteobacteria bacterium]
MKKATLIIWAIIFGVIALLIFQNKAFFLTNQSLQVNLGIIEAYHTPELPIAILVLLFFLIGIFIAFLFSLSARFKARRTIKKLNTTLASHNSEMAGLRSEIDSLKGIETPEATGEMDATQQLTGGSNSDRTAEQTGTFSIDKKDDESADKQKETAEEKK